VAGLPPSPARPAAGRALVVASSHEAARWTGRLAAGDVVIVADRCSRARGLVDAIRRAGAQAIAPPIGAVIAARVHERVTLSAALAPRLAAPAGAAAPAAGVDPLLAPGTEQAVVDVGLAAIVDDGAQPPGALAAQVADARARTLVGGTGRP
jgi:hypothetical protein